MSLHHSQILHGMPGMADTLLTLASCGECLRHNWVNLRGKGRTVATIPVPSPLSRSDSAFSSRGIGKVLQGMGRIQGLKEPRRRVHLGGPHGSHTENTRLTITTSTACHT
jgi:hypothetical protein